MKGDREAEGVNKPPAAQASLASLHFPLLLYPPSLPLKHTADEQGLEIALGEAMKTRIVTLTSPCLEATSDQTGFNGATSECEPGGTLAPTTIEEYDIVHHFRGVRGNPTCI